MSAAPKMCDNPCETCAKEGLPLLLTRYALMPTETGAPKLSGTLDSADLKQVPLGNRAHYGLRLLRSGYVYVHDEARKRWDEYFVTADGFLTKMPPMVMAFKVHPTPATTFRCARNGAAPLAGVITIQNPKHATKIWIAFSSVQWTHTIWQKHADAAFRQKHMRCITISGGNVAPQPGTAPIESIKTHVTEFKMGQASAAQAFGKWCPHLYNGRQRAGDALLKAIQQTRPQGGAAIVALHDPVGLAMEIASLMEFRKVKFMNHEGTAKPRFAASTILSLEGAIKEQTKLAEMIAGQELADSMENSPADYSANAAMAGVPYSNPWAAQKIRDSITQASLEAVANNKWRTYTHDSMGKPRFDAAASKAWLDSHNKGFQKFDAEHIAPLAKAHAAWLQHRYMVNHMSCNHDDANLDSGAAFTATVAAMLRHTSDKQASYELYQKWLKQGDTSAADNLLMRALGFNQKKLLEEINKVDASPLDGRAFPTDMLVGYTKDALEKLPQAGQAAMADLLQSVGGALFKNMDDALKGGPPSHALAAVAAAAGVQFATVQVSGNRGKFVQHMMRAVIQVDPSMKVNHNQMSKAIAAQMRLMEIDGMPMDKTDKRKWLIVLDHSAAQNAAASGKRGTALAQELAKSLHRVENLPGLKAAAFNIGVTSTGFSAGSAFATGLVQSYNFAKLVSDYTNGMQHTTSEAAARLVAGGIAILGSFGEATGASLQKVQEARLRNAMGLTTSQAPDFLRTAGRRLGLGAGLLMAGLDVMRAVDEGTKGDVGLSTAYFLAGGLGAGLAIAFYFSASIPFIGWIIVGIAVLALFVITAWIEKNKDNNIQEWLMRCHFGTRGDKYRSHVEEAEQLKRAFA